MNHREEVRSRVKVLTIHCEKPASILIAQTAVRPDGKSRTITQKLSVADDLVPRLIAELHEGEEIEATIVTEWSRQGYSTYLRDFRVLTRNAILPSMAA